MKKYIISLITILSSLFIIGNVKASTVLVDGNSYDDYSGVITDENIEQLYSVNNLDKSIYDVVIVHSLKYINSPYNSYYNYLYIIILNSEDLKEGYVYSSGTGFKYTKNMKHNIYYYSSYEKQKGSYKTLNLSTINYSYEFDSRFDIVTPGGIGSIAILSSGDPATSKTLYNSTDVKPPSFTYEIKNPSNNKWSIDFKFENLTSDYYYLLKKTINNEIVKKYEYPTTTDSLNVFYDNNLKMELYDKDDNLIDSKVIDVQGLYWKQKSKYYVLYSYLSSNKIFYSYFEVLKDETCWFGETVGQVTSFVEKDCSNSYIYEFNKNNIIHWQIRDKEDKVLFQREISVIGDPNETYINLETELKNDNSVDLKINVQNFKKDSQYIVYRIDKGEEIQVENNKVINFKYNARVDVYVYNLNNTISSTAYKDIVVDVTTLRPSPEYEDLNSILDYFKNITEINSSLLSQFSNFWANLKKSELYIPLLISFIGSCILCVIAILKR